MKDRALLRTGGKSYRYVLHQKLLNRSNDMRSRTDTSANDSIAEKQ